MRLNISATTALLIALVVAFFFQYSGGPNSQAVVLKYFALSTDGLRHGYVWQLLTYQFLHGGIAHIVFNGIALWSFGRYVEARLGTSRYLTLYLLSGVAGGLLQCLAGLIAPERFGWPTIGASAGIFGLVAAFALMEPNAQILAFFVIPIRAKYLLPLSIAACLILPFFPSMAEMAHAAHLGGILFGIFYIKKGIRLTQNLANWNPLRRRSRREKLIRAATVPPLKIRPTAKKSDAAELALGRIHQPGSGPHSRQNFRARHPKPHRPRTRDSPGRPRQNVRAVIRPRRPYCLFGASAACFMSASPFSNGPPHILSMLRHSPMALDTKFFSPDMVHVTTV